jgi:hypothetical protein
LDANNVSIINNVSNVNQIINCTTQHAFKMETVLLKLSNLIQHVKIVMSFAKNALDQVKTNAVNANKITTYSTKHVSVQVTVLLKHFSLRILVSYVTKLAKNVKMVNRIFNV